jgi:transcriptional repressor NF-X1
MENPPAEPSDSGPSNRARGGRRRQRSRKPEAAHQSESPSNGESSLNQRGRGGSHRGHIRRAPAPRSTPNGADQSSVDPSGASNQPLQPDHSIQMNRSVIRSNSPHQSNTPPTEPSSSARRGRGRGRGRHAGSSVVTHAQFAGKLTREQSDLRASATEFTPGAPFNPAAALVDDVSIKGKGKGKTKIQPKMSLSSAPDHATRIHEDIDHQVYECAVCTDEISRLRSKIWFCRTCWAVFHLKCVQKWAGRKQDAPQNGETESKSWRCPGCNLEQSQFPDRFTCWCSKEDNPTSLPGLPPFSCGQTCSRSKKCPHSCSNTCHAGPCTECLLMGPARPCFCGRETKTRICTQTDYQNSWSCERVCDKLMGCGKHKCQKACHDGPCGTCQVTVEARCYCGKDSGDIRCCDQKEEKSSTRELLSDDGVKTTDRWTGCFDCGQDCDRPFDCGAHFCKQPCHVQSEKATHCPDSVDIITHCGCGKTPLTEISSILRTSCTDPIPLCQKQCLKPLSSCEHLCQQSCHTGPCLPCDTLITTPCRCGRSNFDVICSDAQNEDLICKRVCHTNLNCGRHNCSITCCPGERKATERAALKKKLRSIQGIAPTLEPEVEAEHICMRICGRPLKCGTHTCQELCHKGPCPSCRDAIFDELACNCGRTILYPPLPCGTKPPNCRYPCTRQPACGHPVVQHNCHLDSESCPKCPYLVTRLCLCGKSQIKNTPCSASEPRCGSICGKKLKCGFHTCRKSCHAAGQCEDAGTACPHICGKEKGGCGHPCEVKCHSPFPCKVDKPCQHRIMVTCKFT